MEILFVVLLTIYICQIGIVLTFGIISSAEDEPVITTKKQFVLWLIPFALPLFNLIKYLNKFINSLDN